MVETRIKLDAATFCALPMVRRAYMSLVAGLAVFIVTLVVLREPFRGYLAEIRISGPPILGLNLEDATKWLKQADSRAVIIATHAGDGLPRSVRSQNDRRQSNQIRMTYLAPLPTPAIGRLDELAARWLYQYLPQRLSNFRHAELASLRAALAESRECEDAARSQIELLHQEQLTLVLRSAADRPPSGDGPTAVTSAPVRTSVTATSAERDSWRQQLEAMRLALAQLLTRLTEEHPEVISLQSQIERLEQQLPAGERPGGLPADGPELIPAPAADRQASSEGSIRPAAANRLMTARTEGGQTNAVHRSAEELSAAVAEALARAALAGRQRQAAEQRLSDRMQELSSQPAATEWTTEGAHVVTRLGGTPRSATLALGGILAAIGGALMLRGSAVVAQPARLESSTELASVLEIPVIGNMSVLRKAAGRLHRRIFTAGRVRALVHFAEVIVGLAILACLLSIVVEPSLARQVAADPFGTLSEVIGRIGG